MSGKLPVRSMVLGGLALLLSGCGSGDAEYKAYAEKKGLTGETASAFMACAADFKANKPMFPSAKGNMAMSKVPLDICACHSRTLVSLFVENQYRGNRAFAEYMAKEVKKYAPRYIKSDLKTDMKSPAVQKRLEGSLKSCVDGYMNAHQDEKPKLIEFKPLTEPEAKPAKDKKTASN